MDSVEEGRISGTVLVIDDEPSILDAAKMILEMAGLEAHTAIDSQSAMKHLEEGVIPEVLICDYRLPGINGLQIVENIRTSLATEIPVLMMTGDTSEQAIKGRDLKRCVVLRKPFDSERMLALVSDAMTE